MGSVKQNFAAIQQEIVPYTPTIIAVTKYFDKDKLIEAYEAGVRDFGENRITDALAKIGELPEYIKKNSRFHLIGHLQSNKAKKAVGNFDLIHSVDSLSLAEAISEEALKKGVIQKILLQVNNSGEQSKFGLSLDKAREIFPKVLELKGLELKGIMNMAPLNANEKELRELFSEIGNLKDEFEFKYSYKLEISMGMSNDYKIALECGATIIRLGRILFR